MSFNSFKYFSLFTMLMFVSALKAQSTYTFTTFSKNEDCTKGAVGIEIGGLQSNDTLSVTWSSGQTGVTSINDLEPGDYSAHIIIKNKADTTITIKVVKDKCKISISNHFTPNGDNYNDSWQMANTQYYPKFELYVFNKWGQQVHSQKGTYDPWDGKWNGINVPDGTYYYVFYYDGGNKRDLEKGDVTILR